MNEEKYYARADWLAERGYAEGDVMEEDGVEYVIELIDDGERTYKKVLELPPELQAAAHREV